MSDDVERKLAIQLAVRDVGHAERHLERMQAERDVAQSRVDHARALLLASLRSAPLRSASRDLRGADLRENLKGVPIVPNIDAAILAMVEGGGGTLDMKTWHTCETTHCRAGWAITLAGPGGAALEWAMGSAAAGALIYAASRPGKPIPDFYASNEAALADMRAAAAEVAPATARGGK